MLDSQKQMMRLYDEQPVALAMAQQAISAENHINLGSSEGQWLSLTHAICSSCTGLQVKHQGLYCHSWACGIMLIMLCKLMKRFTCATCSEETCQGWLTLHTICSCSGPVQINTLTSQASSICLIGRYSPDADNAGMGLPTVNTVSSAKEELVVLVSLMLTAVLVVLEA